MSQASTLVRLKYRIPTMRIETWHYVKDFPTEVLTEWAWRCYSEDFSKVAFHPEMREKMRASIEENPLIAMSTVFLNLNKPPTLLFEDNTAYFERKIQQLIFMLEKYEESKNEGKDHI